MPKEIDLSHPLLHGLHVPPRLGPGKPDPELREAWLELVNQLMSRGCDTPHQIRKVLGIQFKTAKNWIGEVQSRWAKGLSDELINVRRESLYCEADAVAREAWETALTVAETASEKAALFKVILMANQRKAALTGLDAIEVRVNKTIEQRTTLELVQRVEEEHGLAPGALEALGRSAAKLLSQPTIAPDTLLADSEERVLDAEVIYEGSD